MAFQCDETWVYGGQLLVSKEDVVPTALGVAEEKIDHSAFVQGPMQIGDADSFTEVEATLMVGPDTNEQSPQPPKSLKVNGDIDVIGNSVQIGNIASTTYVGAHIGGRITTSVGGRSGGAKPF